jgi:alpha-L-fucosidase 2
MVFMVHKRLACAWRLITEGALSFFECTLMTYIKCSLNVSSSNSGSFISLALVLLLAFAPFSVSKAASHRSIKTPPDNVGNMVFWYKHPAVEWLDSLPVGNGNLGAMVFGGVEREQIALNEVTFWSGDDYTGPTDRGAEALPRIRELLQDRKLSPEERFATLKTCILGRSLPSLRNLKEASELCNAEMNLYPEAKRHVGTRLPVGDLNLEIPSSGQPISSYRRSLDMRRSLVEIAYALGGVHFRRECFASNPDQVLVMRLMADSKARISFRLKANQWQPLQSPVITTEGSDTLVFDMKALERKHSDGTTGVRLHGRAKVIAEGGTVHADGDAIKIDGANTATVLVAMSTDFRGADPEAVVKARLASACVKPYAQLLADHVADVQPSFDRVVFTLPGNVPDLPTDERMAAYKKSGNDPALETQLFQFGRYLLLAGSRQNSRLPMPLQGLWADGKAASMGWSDDYHFDINTQQNYWPAEVGNLAECFTPLVDFIEQVRQHGRRTAKLTYGAGGWCAHISANAWGSSPFNHCGAPTMGSWQATHLWEHYAFSGDKEFLASVAYPILKENAQFFLDYMMIDPKYGWLVTCPSYSPENHFQDPLTGENRQYTMGNTGDTEVVGELFRECIESSRILGVDGDFRSRLEDARAKLPPLDKLIHPDGRLMEWLEPEYDGVYARGMRHTHHLLGIYPFESINPRLDPVVAKAALTSMKSKLVELGREDTEWTRGNFIHFFARMLDGNAALEQFRTLVDKWIPGATPLSVSWDKIFCLDGNTSATSGVAEMLLQSQGGEICLLPALPSAWPTGSIKGLRARGGFVVDQQWSDGRLTSATIHSARGGPCLVRFGYRTAKLTIPAGGRVILGADLRPIQN